MLGVYFISESSLFLQIRKFGEEEVVGNILLIYWNKISFLFYFINVVAIFISWYLVNQLPITPIKKLPIVHYVLICYSS